MCQCDPVIRLNTEGLRLNKVLKILFFIYILFIIAKIFLKDYNGALSDFINTIVLIFCFLICHYLLTAFLIFMLLFSTFYCAVFLALRLQNKISDLPDQYIADGIYTPIIIVQFLALIFYIVLIYYSFQAFKEFKATYFNEGGYSKINKCNLRLFE
jgi:hypothetical protein